VSPLQVVGGSHSVLWSLPVRTVHSTGDVVMIVGRLEQRVPGLVPRPHDVVVVGDVPGEVEVLSPVLLDQFLTTED